MIIQLQSRNCWRGLCVLALFRHEQLDLARSDESTTREPIPLSQYHAYGLLLSLLRLDRIYHLPRHVCTGSEELLFVQPPDLRHRNPSKAYGLCMDPKHGV